MPSQKKKMPPEPPIVGFTRRRIQANAYRGLLRLFPGLGSAVAKLLRGAVSNMGMVWWGASPAMKKTEVRLRQTVERLALAQQFAGAGIWDWDLRTGKIDWSPELFRLFGLDPVTAEASFDCWRSVLHPEDRAAAEERIGAAVRNRVQLRSEYRIVLPTGEVRWINALGNTRYNDRGEPLNMAGICLDITERKQAEAAMCALHEEQQLILDSVPAMICYKDTENRMLQVNTAVARSLGLPKEQIEGRSMADFYPEEADRYYRDDLMVIRTGLPRLGIEEPYRLSSGEIGWLRKDRVPLRDESGRVSRILVMAVDITERKRAEANLRTASLYVRSLIEASLDPLVTIGIDGRIMDVNSATENVTGMPRHKLIGSDFPFYFTEPEKARTVYQMAFSQGSVTDYALAIRHASGKVTEVLCNANLFRNAEGEVAGVFASARDITERKQAEADLRVAAAVFEAQEGMVVSDARNVILRVNRAFTEITGYTAEEAVGQKMSLLKSGRHDAAFYAAMWERIQRTGSWQGELWSRRKNGEVYPQWLTITAVKGSDGAVTHYVGTLTDITGRRAAEDEIKRLAFYDPLTRLPNRRLLLDRLRQALAAAVRNHRHGALLFIDLDNFKMLNDTLGHDQGDRLLQQVAQRLVACVRESDTVARFGGDEFVVMLEDLSTNMDDAAVRAENVSEKIRSTLNPSYRIADREYFGAASIGVTLFGDRRETVDELLKQADLAMYQAKSAGRNTLRFFDPDMQAALEARAALEAELRSALRDGEFVVYYQPQVDSEGRVTGVEALLRWQHPRRGLVLPDTFIPLAEDTGLIRPLGQWVLEVACRQLAAWASRPETAYLNVAVNVSARQFRHPDFADQVLRVLDDTGADPRKLKLELTESLLVDDAAEAIAKMTALKAQGVGFSLDDFGTGYSSLSYLQQLPLDELKIAQSFVKEVCSNPNDAAIARIVLSLGQTFGLAVIAEGVETTSQRDFLAGYGCLAFQGYLFGRPGPTEALQLAANDGV